MKRLFLFTALIATMLNLTNLYSQIKEPNWVWATPGGDNSSDIDHTLSDSVGNTYVAGNFNNESFTFGSVYLPGNTEGYYESNSVFIVKLNPQGKAEWGLSFYGQGYDSDIDVEDIGLDAEGSIICLMNVGYVDVVNYGNQSVTFNTSSQNTMLVKILRNGRIQYALPLQLTSKSYSYIYGVDLEVLPDGSAFATGYFSADELSIAGETFLASGGDVYNFFALSCDPDGGLIWGYVGRQEDPVMYAGPQTNGIVADGDGNAYLTGTLYNVSYMLMGKFELANVGINDMFVAKFDKSGNILWANNYGGDLNVYAEKIDADREGNITVTGGFNGKAFRVEDQTVYTSSTDYDLFVCKFSTDGNVVWLNSIGMQYTYFYPSDFTHLNAGPSGNVYVVGKYRANSIFSGGNLLPNRSPGTDDIFIVKYDGNSGGILWRRRIATDQSDYINDVVFDNLENIFVTGQFYNDLDLDLTSLTDLENVGSTYILRYDRFGVLMIAKPKLNSQDNYINGSDLSIDGYRNIYLGGTYSGTNVVLEDEAVSNAQTTNGVFVGKLAFTSSMGGTVFDPYGNPVEDGYVKLYSYTNRQRAPRTDSVRIQAGGNYAFINVGYGRYWLYAVPRKVNYPNLAATYYENSIDWVDATPVPVKVDENIGGLDITLNEFLEESGDITLGGNVVQETVDDLNTKSTGGVLAEPVKKVSIILVSQRKIDGEIIAMESTNDFGDFIFEGIPPGCYLVIVDIAGLEHQSYYDICVEEGDEYLNLNYLVDYEKILRTEENPQSRKEYFAPLPDFTIFPNPASDELFVSVNKNGEYAKVEILNTAGKIVLERSILNNQGKSINVNLKNLAPGVYYIRLNGNKLSAPHKFVIY